LNISVNLLGAIVTMMLLGAGGVMTFDFYESNKVASAEVIRRDAQIDTLLKNQRVVLSQQHQIFDHQCKVLMAK
jgi:hypothetical protein